MALYAVIKKTGEFIVNMDVAKEDKTEVEAMLTERHGFETLLIESLPKGSFWLQPRYNFDTKEWVNDASEEAQIQHIENKKAEYRDIFLQSGLAPDAVEVEISNMFKIG